MEKLIRCPMCEEIMVKKNQEYWKCPDCGAEVWPDESKLAYIESKQKQATSMAQLNEQIRWCVGGRYTEVKSMVPEVDRTKGGARVAGRKKIKKDAVREKYWLPM